MIEQEIDFFWLAPAVIWQVLFFCLPLFFVAALSVLKDVDGSFFQLLTLDHYAQFFQMSYVRIITRSTVMALINGLVCAIFAYPVAYYLVFYARRLKNILLFFLILPFWVSFLVQIYAWFFVLARQGILNSALLKIGLITTPLHILNTSFAVYLVMFYCYVPFMIMPIYSVLEKSDKRLLEASSDLGATAWQTFIRVTLPLTFSGLKTGFFLVFIPSFGEFVIPALLGGGKKMYVGTLISRYFLVVRDVRAGSAFTVLSGCILVVCALMCYLLFRYILGAQKA